MIVVDDGSIDDTPAVLAGVDDKRVRVIRLPINQGQSKARNVGIDAATGPFVAFCDSDDEWLPTKVRVQLRAFGAQDPPSLVYSGMWIDDGSTRRSHAEDLEGRAFDQALGLIGLITTSGMMIDRTLAAGELYFDESLPCAVDRDLLIRLSQHHPVGRVPEPLFVHYMHHGPQISAQLCYPGAWKAIMKKYADEFEVRPRTAAAVHFRIALILHRARNHRGAHKALQEAARLDPGNRRYRTLGACAALGGAGSRFGLDAYVTAARVRHAVVRAG